MLATLLSSLLPLAGQVLAAALLAMGTWTAARLADWLRLSADSQVRGYLLNIVDVAVEAARTEIARLNGAPMTGVARGMIVQRATNYVQDRAPDALRRFGLDDAALREMVERRLDGARS